MRTCTEEGSWFGFVPMMRGRGRTVVPVVAGKPKGRQNMARAGLPYSDCTHSEPFFTHLHTYTRHACSSNEAHPCSCQQHHPAEHPSVSNPSPIALALRTLTHNPNQQRWALAHKPAVPSCSPRRPKDAWQERSRARGARVVQATACGEWREIVLSGA